MSLLVTSPFAAVAVLGRGPVEHTIGTGPEVAHVGVADAVERCQSCPCGLNGRAEAIAQLSILFSCQAWKWKAVLHAPVQVDDPAAHPQQRLQG